MFCTVDVVRNSEKDNHVQCVRNIIHAYKKSSFRINIIYMDGKFESLRVNKNGINIELNVLSND